MSMTLRKSALIGLVQGGALAALQMLQARDVWPGNSAPLLLALLYALVAMPLAWYLTEGIPELGPTRRRWTVLLIGIALGLLGGYEGWAGADATGGPRVGPATFACAALGFIGIPLLAHARQTWRWDYATLFQTTWRNGFVLLVAGMLTGILWGVLAAGSALMRSIGIAQISVLIEQPWFALPVTGIAFGCAMAVALARMDTIVALRRFWLSMNQAFLPLVLGFAAMWAIALPFTGTDALMETRMAGLALLWFAALAVNFVNAAYQDGQGRAPFAAWLRRALTIAWLAMLLVVGIAAFAIQQRIAQYGWTVDRVWSVFVLVMAAGYAVGYSLSVAPRGRWMWSVGPTNIVMAIVLCAGLVALSSPLADPRRISVDSQVERLLSGKTTGDNFDFYYLNHDNGIHGRRAVQRLADGVPGHPDAERLAQSARDAQAASIGYQEPVDQSDEMLRSAWRAMPDGATTPPAAVDALLAQLRSSTPLDDACLRARPWHDKPSRMDTRCAVWMVDLDADGSEELVLIVDQEWNRTAHVYQWTPASGQLSRIAKMLDLTPEWVAAVEAGRAVLGPSRWRDVEAGGLNVRVLPAD